MRYQKLVKRQKVEKLKLVEVNKEEKQKVKRILNKRMVQICIKYLVYWKGFTVDYSIWKKKIDLENIKEVVVEFGKRMNTEVRKKKIDRVKDRDLRKRITRKIYRKITV